MTLAFLAEASFSPGVAAESWEDAVRAAGRDLVHARAVGPAYVDEMVRLIDEGGPWCVLAPGIAVPHASSSPLVRRDAAAIVALKEPVAFGHPHHDPVRIVIAVAATTQAQHILHLAELGVRLDDAGVVDRVLAATTREEAVAAITGSAA